MHLSKDGAFDHSSSGDTYMYALLFFLMRLLNPSACSSGDCEQPSVPFKPSIVSRLVNILFLLSITDLS